MSTQEQKVTPAMRERLKQIYKYGLRRTTPSVYATVWWVRTPAPGVAKPDYAILLRMENLGLIKWQFVKPDEQPLQEAFLTPAGCAVIGEEAPPDDPIDFLAKGELVREKKPGDPDYVFLARASPATLIFERDALAADGEFARGIEAACVQFADLDGNAYADEVRRRFGLLPPLPEHEEAHCVINAVTNHAATRVVHTPSGPAHACDEHAEQLTGLYSFLGAHVVHTGAPDGAQCANCINEAKEKEHG